jgi:hypothetical protein
MRWRVPQVVGALAGRRAGLPGAGGAGCFSRRCCMLLVVLALVDETLRASPTFDGVDTNGTRFEAWSVGCFLCHHLKLASLNGICSGSWRDLPWRAT